MSRKSLVPFRYDEHDGVWPEGGYEHEAGILNHTQRRHWWRTNSSRDNRMTIKAIKVNKVYRRLEAKRIAKESLKLRGLLG